MAALLLQRLLLRFIIPSNKLGYVKDSDEYCR